MREDIDEVWREFAASGSHDDWERLHAIGIGIATRTARIVYESSDGRVDLDRLTGCAIDKMVATISKYDPGRKVKLSTWIIFCVRRELKRELKRKKVPPLARTNYDFYGTASSKPQDPTEGYKAAEEMLAAIEGISDASRAVIRRHVIDGESLSAIAREEGVTREAIRQRILRALQHANLDAPRKSA
jgi:RNA polymerase sigma factor (sigma-70 family)